MEDSQQSLDTSGLAPEVLALIESGEAKVAGPGQELGRPVVVYASSGRFVAGTGRPANANDVAEVSRDTAFKRTKAYADALNRFIPAYKEQGAISSLEELLEAARKVTTDTTYHTEVVHACSECGHEDVVPITIPGKPDAKVLTFLIERLVGAANKTQEVNVHTDEVMRIMTDQRVLHQLEVVSLTPEQLAERKRLVLEG